MTTEIFAQSISLIEKIYIEKGLAGFRIDMKHAQKSYGKTIHYLPIEMEIGDGKWVPVSETLDIKTIHDPVFKGQKYPGARISFVNNGFAHTCEVVLEIANKLVAQMSAQPWISARVKTAGVHQSFIQTMSKAGSLDQPIMRASLRFKKVGDVIADDQVCDTQIVLQDKSMPPVAYGDINRVVPAGSLIRAQIDISTVVLSSQGLNLRCEASMMHIRGFEPMARESVHKSAADIIEALQ